MKKDRCAQEAVFGLGLSSILLTAILTTLSLTPIREGRPAYAAGSASNLRVGAVVLPNTELTTLYQAPLIVVSERDIERGYVDMASATRLRIKTNLKSGYTLFIEGLGGPFREAYITGLAHEIQINSAGAFVHQPYSKKTVSAELGYRFILSETAKAGGYAWPLAISLYPAF